MKEILDQVDIDKCSEIEEDFRIRRTRPGENIDGEKAGFVFEIKLKQWSFVSCSVKMEVCIKKALVKLHNSGYVDLKISQEESDKELF